MQDTHTHTHTHCGEWVTHSLFSLLSHTDTVPVSESLLHHSWQTRSHSQVATQYSTMTAFCQTGLHLNRHTTGTHWCLNSGTGFSIHFNFGVWALWLSLACWGMTHIFCPNKGFRGRTQRRNMFPQCKFHFQGFLFISPIFLHTKTQECPW